MLSINVGFGVGLAEWGSKSTFALQDSESHMSALGHQRPVDTPAAVAPCPLRPKSEHSFEAV
jgi:hypothetical protein